MLPAIGHIQVASVPSRNEPTGEELNDGFLFALLDSLGYGRLHRLRVSPTRQDTRRPRLVRTLCSGPAHGRRRMTLSLGCIADDYTGASDLANTLARNGLRTVQTIGIPAETLTLPDVDRGGGLAEDPLRACRRGGGARPRGGSLAAPARRRHVMYKICSTFDSTDAGNIGPVMDALAADAGAATVLVTPAFPETGRTVYQGHLFVNGVPLHESPLKDHPLNPCMMRTSCGCWRGRAGRPWGSPAFRRWRPAPARCASALPRLARQAPSASSATRCSSGIWKCWETWRSQPRSRWVASGLGLGLARALVRSGRGDGGGRG